MPLLTLGFQPQPTEKDTMIQSFLESLFQMDLPIKKISLSDVKTIVLKNANSKISPVFNLIMDQILKELSTIGLAILYVVNAVLRLSY